MRNPKVVLYNLAKQAKKEDYKFRRIYRNLYNPKFYLKAYDNIYANSGSATAGIDNETADAFSMDKIEKIIKQLKKEKYQPKPVRREYIDKDPNGNKQRPLGIPTFRDRIVQEVVRMILEAIYEENFSEHSHGFRPDRSCHTALTEIKRTFAGVNWFIECDIKSYFDTIDHHILVNILRRRIEDEKFIRLIWKFLGAGYMENWKYYGTYSGTPQGGIVSPILANIYLNELDEYMEEFREEFRQGKPSDKKRNSEYRKYAARIRRLKKKYEPVWDEISDERKEEVIRKKRKWEEKKRNLPYYDPDQSDSEYRDVKYLRYADDFIIGVHGSKQDCREVRESLSDFLAEKLNLQLSTEKTVITHSSDRARFLGYDITSPTSSTLTKDKRGYKVRRNSNRISLYMPENKIRDYINEQDLVKNVDAEEWRMKHRPKLINNPELEIVAHYNAEIRGLYNYYKLAENVSTYMWQLRHVMEYSCLATLANKRKSTISKVKDDLSNGKHWGIWYETKDGEKFMPFYNKGFSKVKNSDMVDIDEKKVDRLPNLYPYYNNTTSLVDRILASKCEYCGRDDSDATYEVHHVNKLKKLKGKREWEKVMIAKNRKTLIMCKECHTKLHQGNLD
ncbi:reverse transcriptase domain-containing protein [Halanaerobacter jeridensis]|uniref:Group II intron reverse transcriptase/maturase n=1 Tax=Halanaerobacter jeridensis TaxID=706427 RepID=A0A938XVN2_9FIRM|nr:reverse transcriptase domain-containing protein [Halanaerobacter jeridensis]MBM7556442.1 group II intron reverse transcriptase/maturase [Halanaerobacter jeridensis]